jgi:hypothetical protein
MTDPRYDEQFRRGYDGPPVPPPLPATSASSQRDVEEIPSQLGQVRIVDEPEAVAPMEADRPRGIDATRPFRRNPFAIALLAGGVLMVVVGVWTIERSVSLTSIVFTPEQQAVIEAESQLSAPLLTGGVIAIVAWLALGVFAASAAGRVD